MNYPSPLRLVRAWTRPSRRQAWGLILAFSLALPAVSQPRKTVYLDKMDGLEPFVEKALQAVELPLDFLEEKQRPELKATLSRMHSAYGEILFRYKLGRTETHTLEFLDVERNKVIARYSFQMGADAATRERIAEAFARRVKQALAKQL